MDGPTGTINPSKSSTLSESSTPSETITTIKSKNDVLDESKVKRSLSNKISFIFEENTSQSIDSIDSVESKLKILFNELKLEGKETIQLSHIIKKLQNDDNTPNNVQNFFKIKLTKNQHKQEEEQEETYISLSDFKEFYIIIKNKINSPLIDLLQFFNLEDDKIKLFFYWINTGRSYSIDTDIGNFDLTLQEVNN